MFHGADPLRRSVRGAAILEKLGINLLYHPIKPWNDWTCFSVPGHRRSFIATILSIWGRIKLPPMVYPSTLSMRRWKWAAAPCKIKWHDRELVQTSGSPESAPPRKPLVGVQESYSMMFSQDLGRCSNDGPSWTSLHDGFPLRMKGVLTHDDHTTAQMERILWMPAEPPGKCFWEPGCVVAHYQNIFMSSAATFDRTHNVNLYPGKRHFHYRQR
ncbi:uncharacterized protein LOC120541604 isoform X2 [Polypterus senegalus]|nr:uncharacterized protein LOC120541604 isoform X2 [Polypterus senegalus]